MPKAKPSSNKKSVDARARPVAKPKSNGAPAPARAKTTLPPSRLASEKKKAAPRRPPEGQKPPPPPSAKKAPVRVIVPRAEDNPIKRPKTTLKRAEVQTFRDLLLTKRDNLVGDLKSMESQAFRASGQDSSANHMADYGSDNYEQDFTLGLIETDQATVAEVNEALQRVDAGEYGMCLECNGEIPTARLEILPWTRYCVRCQEKVEKM